MAPKKRPEINPNLFAKTETASQQEALPSEPQAVLPSSTQGGKPQKLTLYLDPALLARLDAARATLRAMAKGPKDRGAVTLSAIAAAALEAALGDLEQNKAESGLARKVVRS